MEQVTSEISNTGDSPVANTYPPLFLQDPAALTAEIYKLWTVHREYDGNIKVEKSKLIAVGNSLGELLYAMKNLLASPGRNGGWSRFLREQHINRATADRLVTRYANSVNPPLELPHEAISEPTEADVQKLFASVWPKLEKKLTTNRAVYQFIAHLLQYTAYPQQSDETGILVLNPDSESGEAVAQSAETEMSQQCEAGCA